MIKLLILAFVLISCGSKNSSEKDEVKKESDYTAKNGEIIQEQDKLADTWWIYSFSEDELVGLYFYEDKTCSFSIIYVVTDNYYQTQMSICTYEVTEKEINLTVTASSNPEQEKLITYKYQLDLVNSNLFINIDYNYVIFELLAEEAKSGASNVLVKTGWFDDDGNFNERAVTELQ